MIVWHSLCKILSVIITIYIICNIVNSDENVDCICYIISVISNICFGCFFINMPCINLYNNDIGVFVAFCVYIL